MDTANGIFWPLEHHSTVVSRSLRRTSQYCGIKGFKRGRRAAPIIPKDCRVHSAKKFRLTPLIGPSIIIIFLSVLWCFFFRVFPLKNVTSQVVSFVLWGFFYSHCLSTVQEITLLYFWIFFLKNMISQVLSLFLYYHIDHDFLLPIHSVY